MIVLHLLLIIALCFVMGKAAQHIAISVRSISKHMGLSDFIVAFGLLGLATSMPEISVAVFSAVRSTPSLSLGNLIGANIFVLSLLAGVAAIMAGRLSPTTFYKNHTLTLFLADVLLVVYAVSDGRLTRADGVLLTFAHVAFIGHVYRSHREDRKALVPESDVKHDPFARSVAGAIGAVSVLLVASYFLVNSALVVANALGAPPVVIGLLLFSIGTSLPELTFVITQSRKHKDIVLGDLFGSVLLNTPTLGLLGLISPFEFSSREEVLISAAFLATVVILFGTFMWSKRALVRREGYWLVGCYAVFLVYYAGRL